MSVKDGDIVKHYRILKTDEGDYFIARTLTFATLNQLVEHYSNSSDGLCGELKNACLKVCIRNLYLFMQQLFIYYIGIVLRNAVMVILRNFLKCYGLCSDHYKKFSKMAYGL